MRKNTLVKFIDEKKKYDPTTSENITSKEIVREMYCNVTDLTRKKSLESYGEYIKKGKVIRLTNSLDFKFSNVEIGGDIFNLFDSIEALGRTSIVVRGVDM